ncbi:hypothetical protein L1F30_13360 [Simiduia sp. 21SJ11W-1]|uniref:hypothetical protein n=1 Tax=Simiduia sp. 21SJ11W-1 TaxID=2909669 RepID=UPI00209E36DC|nr:hypothetical protein [Simiduia sp. 21SJ11W-1]UTA47145.1 hypothetical protein L1F30_13360 [Simiduia sp. 21SJ11W-1]
MYLHTRKAIIQAGFDPEVVEVIAASISASESLSCAKEIFRIFIVEAEKLPWPQDTDFGSLVLQSKSAQASNLEVKRFMLEEAILRAQWCATCATSVGEGLARMVHVDVLKAELEKCN